MSSTDSDAAQPPASPPRQDHGQDRSVQEPSASESKAANAASSDDANVGNILAQLNQEQLASIVAAARASEASNRRSDGVDGQGSDQAGDSYNHLSDGVLANLPPGLGQAASALTSFASSFKRSVHAPQPEQDQDATAQEKLDDAPPPPGTEYQAEQLQERDLDDQKDDQHHHDPDLAAAQAAHDSATAAAIASLGSLAAQQSEANLRQPGASTPGGGRDALEGSASPGSSSGKRHGGPELDRQRKDNHKEVERRRRSAIADGINQLSQIVPGCDAKNTNKSSIIVAAVRYIQDLKNNEASNIEKWTLEKLLMDQAMGDLSGQLDECRRENERLRALVSERGWAEGEGEEGVEGQESQQQQAETQSHPEQQPEDDQRVHPDLREEVDGGEAADAHPHAGEKRSLDEVHKQEPNDEADGDRAKRAKVAVAA